MKVWPSFKVIFRGLSRTMYERPGYVHHHLEWQEAVAGRFHLERECINLQSLLLAGGVGAK